MSLRSKIAADLSKPRVSYADQEIARIVALPIREELTPAEVEEVSRQYLQAHHFDAGLRLFEPQARALLEWILFKGILGPISVGDGKTLTTLLIASEAYREGFDKILLIVPPEVYGQLVETDIPWARDRIDLCAPMHYFGGKGKSERAYLYRSGRRGCYVMPYTCLQNADGWELLTGVAPKLIILDEAQNVKNRKSARSQRLLNYLKSSQAKVVALSGTLTDKSIEDYHHLVSYALGAGSPLPLSWDLAQEWAAILDAAASPSEANAGPIMPLMEWARKHSSRWFKGLEFPPTAEGFRAAYRCRLNSSPGVVKSDKNIGTSLVYHNQPVPKHTETPGWEELNTFIKNVDQLWESPSGDKIDWAFHKWQSLAQLHSGFYYRHFWPTPADLVQRRRWSEAEAEQMLDLALAHHEASQEYHRELRPYLEYEHRPGLDSPSLVGASMHRHRMGQGALIVPEALYALWCKMKDLEVPGLPERDREPVRVCPFKIDHVVRWAQHNASSADRPGGIIWFMHQAIGDWLFEAMRAAELPVIYCPAESEQKGSDTKIRSQENRDKFIIASYAHGVGKNLQFHQHMFYAQWSRESTDAEQSVGRIHRTGQAADSLEIGTCNTTEFDHQNFASTLVDALYHHQTTGVRQRLIYGVHNPLPKIYPSGFLRENGFQNKKLDAEKERMFRERFQGK